MPTDSLVDIVVPVKLVNVRKSQVDKIRNEMNGRINAQPSLFGLIGPATKYWDAGEVGDLQIIGDAIDMGSTAAWSELARAESSSHMPSCVPMPVMVPGDDKAKALGDLAERFKKLEASGKVKTMENGEGEAKPEAGVVSTPAKEKQKYQRMPVDFEETVLAFIRDYPDRGRKDIAEHLNVKVPSLMHYIEKLLEKGLIQAVRKGDSKWDGVVYSAIYNKKSDSEKEAEGHIVTPPTALARGGRVSQEQLDEGDKTRSVETAKKLVPPATKPEIKKPAKTMVLDEKDASRVWAMPAGEEKDRALEGLVLEMLSKAPGISTAIISIEIRQSATTTRKFLAELEETGKVERRMVPTSDGRNQKIGYYLKLKEEAALEVSC